MPVYTVDEYARTSGDATLAGAVRTLHAAALSPLRTGTCQTYVQRGQRQVPLIVPAIVQDPLEMGAHVDMITGMPILLCMAPVPLPGFADVPLSPSVAARWFPSHKPPCASALFVDRRTAMLPRCPQCNDRYVPLKEVHRREGGASILSSCLACRLELDQPFAPDCHVCFDGYGPFHSCYDADPMPLAEYIAALQQSIPRNTVATLVRIIGDQAIWPLKGLGDKHPRGLNQGTALGSLLPDGKAVYDDTVLRAIAECGKTSIVSIGSAEAGLEMQMLYDGGDRYINKVVCIEKNDEKSAPVRQGVCGVLGLQEKIYSLTADATLPQTWTIVESQLKASASVVFYFNDIECPETTKATVKSLAVATAARCGIRNVYYVATSGSSRDFSYRGESGAGGVKYVVEHKETKKMMFASHQVPPNPDDGCRGTHIMVACGTSATMHVHKLTLEPIPEENELPQRRVKAKVPPGLIAVLAEDGVGDQLFALLVSSGLYHSLHLALNGTETKQCHLRLLPERLGQFEFSVRQVTLPRHRSLLLNKCATFLRSTGVLCGQNECEQARMMLRVDAASLRLMKQPHIADGNGFHIYSRNKDNLYCGQGLKEFGQVGAGGVRNADAHDAHRPYSLWSGRTINPLSSEDQPTDAVTALLVNDADNQTPARLEVQQVYPSKSFTTQDALGSSLFALYPRSNMAIQDDTHAAPKTLVQALRHPNKRHYKWHNTPRGFTGNGIRAVPLAPSSSFTENERGETSVIVRPMTLSCEAGETTGEADRNIHPRTTDSWGAQDGNEELQGIHNSVLTFAQRQGVVQLPEGIEHTSVTPWASDDNVYWKTSDGKLLFNGASPIGCFHKPWPVELYSVDFINDPNWMDRAPKPLNDVIVQEVARNAALECGHAAAILANNTVVELRHCAKQQLRCPECHKGTMTVDSEQQWHCTQCNHSISGDDELKRLEAGAGVSVIAVPFTVARGVTGFGVKEEHVPIKSEHDAFFPEGLKIQPVDPSAPSQLEENLLRSLQESFDEGSGGRGEDRNQIGDVTMYTCTNAADRFLWTGYSLVPPFAPHASCVDGGGGYDADEDDDGHPALDPAFNEDFTIGGCNEEYTRLLRVLRENNAMMPFTWYPCAVFYRYYCKVKRFSSVFRPRLGPIRRVFVSGHTMIVTTNTGYGLWRGYDTVGDDTLLYPGSAYCRHVAGLEYLDADPYLIYGLTANIKPDSVSVFGQTIFGRTGETDKEIVHFAAASYVPRSNNHLVTHSDASAVQRVAVFHLKDRDVDKPDQLVVVNGRRTTARYNVASANPVCAVTEGSGCVTVEFANKNYLPWGFSTINNSLNPPIHRRYNMQSDPDAGHGFGGAAAVPGVVLTSDGSSKLTEQVASGLITQMPPFAAVELNHVPWSDYDNECRRHVTYWGNPALGPTIVKDARTGTVLHSNEIPLDTFRSFTYKSACRQSLGGSTVLSMPNARMYPKSFRMKKMKVVYEMDDPGLLAQILHNAEFRVQGVTTHVFSHAACEQPVYVCDELGAVVCMQAFLEHERDAFRRADRAAATTSRCLAREQERQLWFGDLAAEMMRVQNEQHAVTLRQSEIREIMSESKFIQTEIKTPEAVHQLFGKLLQKAQRLPQWPTSMQRLVSLERKVKDGATCLTQVNAEFQILLAGRLGDLEVEAGKLSSQLRACRTKRDAVANATSPELNWVVFALPGGKLWDRVFPSNTGSIWSSENQHSSGIIRKFCALPGWTSATIHKCSVLGLNEGWSDYDGNYQPICPSVTAVPLMIAPLARNRWGLVSGGADPRYLQWAVPVADPEYAQCKTAELWNGLIRAMPERLRTITPNMPKGYVADYCGAFIKSCSK